MRIFHYFLLLAALTATTGCDKGDDYYPSPKFEGDPTAGYISNAPDVDFDMMVSQESPDPDIFYTYFCLCNASDHKIDVMLAFHGEYGYKVMGWVIDHGEKFTGRLETFKSKGAAGLISSFTPILARLEVYYDVDNDEYGNIKYPSGIDERYSDFTQRFKTRQICDQGQWIYEEFTPRRARWTYIFTNEDYERAKMMSEKPD